MRWMQRDPIGHSGGVNIWEYANGNPVRYVDPDGLSPDDHGPRGKSKMSAEGFNLKSDPNELEDHIKELQKECTEDPSKRRAYQRRLKQLEGILKVIKRGGSRAFIPFAAFDLAEKSLQCAQDCFCSGDCL